MFDRIRVVDLVVAARVGVPDAERSAPQRLLITLELELDLSAASRSDDLRETVDYAAVAERVRRLAETGERRLVERLAGEIADDLLKSFDLKTVRVEIKKFILPQVGHVAVVLNCSRGESSPPSQNT